MIDAMPDVFMLNGILLKYYLIFSQRTKLQCRLHYLQTQQIFGYHLELKFVFSYLVCVLFKHMFYLQ